MEGNVSEWTRSDFDQGTKCARGASYRHTAMDLRVASWYWPQPGVSLGDLGFRCVWE